MDLDPERQTLAHALAAHVAADAEEQRHLDVLSELVRRVATCFDRSTFEPGHVTGSAFVVDPAGRLLLHHHRRLDRWLQLGGHDDGERDPLRTALREAREESGLTDLELLVPSILDVDVHSIPEGKREPAHLHHDVRYLFVTRSPERIARDDAESHALAFFSLDEAERLLAEPSAKRVITKIRRCAASLRRSAT